MPSIPHLLTIALCWMAATAFGSDPMGVVYAPALAKREAFTGTLGGSAPAITGTGDSQRPYGVNGDTFTDYESAAERSCNKQFDTCQRLANTDSSASFSLQDCQSQLTSCMATQPSTADGGVNLAMATDSAASSSSSSSSSNSDSEPNKVMGQMAQTTIPYDSEFDLVCDL